MKAAAITRLITAAALLGLVLVVQAGTLQQTPTNRPPAIITFDTELDSIILSEAEAGETTTNLSWHVIHMTDEYDLALEAYSVDQWTSILDDGEILMPVDTQSVTLAHPLYFGPLMYRLSVRDEADSLVDQRIVTISYDDGCEDIAAEEDEEAPSADPPPTCPPDPQIEVFSTHIQAVDTVSLANGEARIPVLWEVTNRLPGTNLIFEQLLVSAGATPIELPRRNLWVNSMGSGELSPILPDANEPVRLRMRVLDVISGQVYDEAELVVAVIPGSTPTPFSVQPVPTQPPSDASAQIISFMGSPDPAMPTDTITLRWETRGAAAVRIRWLDLDYAHAVISDLPPSGSIEIPLTNIMINGSSVRFSLYALDEGNQPIHDSRDLLVATDLDIELTTDMFVDSFTASPDPVERGGTLTLTWSVPGAHQVGISRVSVPGILTLPVNEDTSASGSTVLTIPQEHVANVTFLLGATDQYGVSISEMLIVPILCPIAEYIAPWCPETQQTIQAAYQAFQNGFMVWRADTQQIYVLYDDGTFAVFQDSWSEGEPVDIEESPPDGLIAPQRGFGKLWVMQPAVRSRLGWATTQEASYTTPLETTRQICGRVATGTGIHLRLPDNRIIHLSGCGTDWRTG